MSASLLPPPATRTPSRTNNGSSNDKPWNTELDDFLEKMPLKPSVTASSSASVGATPSRRSTATTESAKKNSSAASGRRKESSTKRSPRSATEKKKKSPTVAEPSGRSTVNLGISIEELYGFDTAPVQTVAPRSLPVKIQPRGRAARLQEILQQQAKEEAQSKTDRYTRSKSRSSSRSPLGRSVSFDKVQIREFQQILGEHPCIDSGPSLTLGWDYKEKKGVCLYKYESKRNNSTGNLTRLSPTRNRNIRKCALSPQERTDKAMSLGYSKEDILNNRKQIRRIQKQREETLRNCYDDRDK